VGMKIIEDTQQPPRFRDFGPDNKTDTFWFSIPNSMPEKFKGPYFMIRITYLEKIEHNTPDAMFKLLSMKIDADIAESKVVQL